MSENIENEDEVLANVEYSQLSEKQKILYDRRVEVNELSLYKTEQQMADKLDVSLSTIERDMVWIKKFVSDRWVDDLAHHGYSHMTMSFTKRNEESLRILYSLRNTLSPEKNGDDIEPFLKIQAEIDKIEVLVVEMTGAGPALKSVKKAIAEKESHDLI